MRPRALAASLLLAVAGCGDAAAPTRLPELEAEVRAATRALLEAPGFVGTAVRQGEERTVTRVDWADWRATGDYRLASLGVPEPGAAAAQFGLVQIGADLYSAQAGPLGDEPWALEEDPTSGSRSA